MVVFFLFPFSSLNPQESPLDYQTNQEYTAALRWMGKGQYDKAVKTLKKMIETNRAPSRVWVKMVEAYRWKHTLDEGLGYLESLARKNPDNPGVHYGLGLAYKEKKNYPKALEHFHRTLQLEPGYCKAFKDLVDVSDQMKSIQNAADDIGDFIRRNPNNAAAHFGLGYFYQVQTRWNEALENADKAAQLDGRLLDVYHLKGMILYGMSRFQDFLEISGAGLKLAENVGDLELQCLFWGDMGLACYYLSNYPEALTYCSRALDLAREIGDKTEELRSLSNIGIVYRDTGKLLEALKSFDEALMKSQEIGDRRREGLCFRNIGTVHYLLVCDYLKALGYYQKALPILTEIGDKHGIALTLWDLGSVYWNLGNYRSALKYLKEALQMADEIGDQSIKQMCLGIKGLVHWNLGQYPQALDCYEKALVLAREHGEKRWEGVHLGNMAVVYDILGDGPKALKYYEQALELAVQTGSQIEEGRHLSNIGGIYHALGQHARALEYYRKAVDLAKQSGNKRIEADFLGNIGKLYTDMGNYTDAEINIKLALQLAQNVGDKRCEANQYTGLGGLHVRLNDLSTALLVYQKARDIGRKIMDPDIVWNSDLAIGSIHEKLGELEKALSQYRTAIQGIENLRETLHTETFRTLYMENRFTAYERMIHLLVEMHQRAPLKGYDVESFRIAEMSKARSLLDILYQGKTFHDLDEIPDEFRKAFLSNEGLLEKKYGELSSEWNQGNGVQNRARLAQIEEEINKLQNEKALLLEQLKQHHPEYYRLTHPRLFSVPEIQREILTDDQVLVEYMVCDERIYVWVLTKREMGIHVIKMDRKRLEDDLNRISPLFSKEKENADVEIDHRWANFKIDSLLRLYQILFQDPVLKYLKKGCQLTIVPDGFLHYFPFEILVTDRKEGEAHYLIESYPISYASSASLLNPELQRKRKATKTLLAFGNPSFDKAEPNKGILDWISVLDPLKVVLRGGRFQPLPQAEREVRAIAENFEDPAVFTGKEATEERFKKMAADFRLIHLATHHLISDRQPMYSKIVLAQTEIEEEDGYLQTYEIANLKLNADMAVLSGCNSGLGKFSRGEGLISLSRAFLYAGVPSLVVSMWPVEDESTAWFMKAFYGYLKSGLNKARALQQAKIDLIRSADSKRDPFYWGPFVLIGDYK